MPVFVGHQRETTSEDGERTQGFETTGQGRQTMLSTDLDAPGGVVNAGFEIPQAGSLALQAEPGVPVGKPLVE